MKKILHIVSSIKGDASFSVQLSNAILEKLAKTYPGSQVYTHDLTKAPFPHLEAVHLGAFMTLADNHTPEQKEAIKHSNNAIKEITEADIIVIGIPLYNFGIPGILKAWIDHIVRAGVSFRYNENGGYEGLVTNKKVYLAIASGSIYSEGPMKSFDFTEPYMRTILGFIGMTDVSVFRVEGTVVPAFMENAVPKAMKAVEEFAF